MGNIYVICKERPDKVYVEMNEINNNQSLIGLSTEQVVELLGKPKYEWNNENTTIYVYDAGTITNGFYWGNSIILLDCHDLYELRIFFDANDKVHLTKIGPAG